MNQKIQLKIQTSETENLLISFINFKKKLCSLFHFWWHIKKRFFTFKHNVMNLLHINNFLLNFAFLIRRILELFTCKVCKIFVYKHTEAIEYVIK